MMTTFDLTAFKPITKGQRTIGRPTKNDVSVNVAKYGAAVRAVVSIGKPVAEALGVTVGDQIHILSNDRVLALQPGVGGYKLGNVARGYALRLSLPPIHFPHIAVGERVEFDVSYQDGVAICTPRAEQ